MSQEKNTFSLSRFSNYELRELASDLFFTEPEQRLEWFSCVENAERAFNNTLQYEDVSSESKILSKLKLLKSFNNDLISKRIRLHAGLEYNKVSDSNFSEYEHRIWKKEEFFSTKMGFKRRTTEGDRLKSKFLADAYAVHSVAVEKGLRCGFLSITLQEPVLRKHWYKDDGMDHILSGKESSENLIEIWTSFKNKAVKKKAFGIRFLDVDVKGNMHLHIVFFYEQIDEKALRKCFYKTMRSNSAGKVQFAIKNQKLVHDKNYAINYLAKKYDDEKWLATLSRANAITSRTYQLFGINLQTTFYNALLKNIDIIHGVSSDFDELHSLIVDKNTRASRKKFLFITCFFEKKIAPVKIEALKAAKKLVGIEDVSTGVKILWDSVCKSENNDLQQYISIESEGEVTERLQNQYDRYCKNKLDDLPDENDEVNVSTIKVVKQVFSLPVVLPDHWAASVVEHTQILLVSSFTVHIEGLATVQSTSCNAGEEIYALICVCIVAYPLASSIRGPPAPSLFHQLERRVYNRLVLKCYHCDHSPVFASI